jgi:recombinational DNA repair protein RecT
VFKRLSKWIPQSPEMRQAIDYDDEDYRKFTPEIKMPDEDLSQYDAIDLDQTPEEDPEGTQVDTNDEGAPV